MGLLREEETERSIRIVAIDDENDLEEIDGAYEKAHLIAKESGVNILRGKDLKSVAVNDNGDVIGGLWTEISGDEFSFDIAVDKSYRGMGVGIELIKEAFSLFNLENYEEQLRYVVDVTNPIMEKILLKYGFIVSERYGGHTIMTHPTNNPKVK